MLQQITFLPVLALCLGAVCTSALLRRVIPAKACTRRSAPLPIWGARSFMPEALPKGALHSERVLRTPRQLRALMALLLASLALMLVQLLTHHALSPLHNLILLLSFVLTGLLLWQSLRARHWELRYDVLGLTLKQSCARSPSGQLWRNLVAIERRDPLAVALHFNDGLVMRVPNHIEGREDLLQIAEHWIATSHGALPHARITRG